MGNNLSAPIPTATGKQPKQKNKITWDRTTKSNPILAKKQKKFRFCDCFLEKSVRYLTQESLNGKKDQPAAQWIGLVVI